MIIKLSSPVSVKSKSYTKETGVISSLFIFTLALMKMLIPTTVDTVVTATTEAAATVAIAAELDAAADALAALDAPALEAVLLPEEAMLLEPLDALLDEDDEPEELDSLLLELEELLLLDNCSLNSSSLLLRLL